MKKLCALIAIFALSGCATSTFNHQPAKDNGPLVNVVKSPLQFDIVWDKLVRELSSDFFVINNIDKSSRLMNVSFSSNTPELFVDCGKTERTFTNARGTQKYTYATADSSSFITTNEVGHGFHINRTATLSGRTNIYVAPEGEGTVVTVNTKYVLNIKLNGQVMGGGPLLPTDNQTTDFSTKEAGKMPSGPKDPTAYCYSKGVLEKRILEIVPVK